MKSLRAISIMIAFAGFTLPLMPLQWLFVATRSPWAATFPHWYHRQVARLLGVRIHTAGAIESERPLLLAANHSSWLDIIVLSAVAPISFVAKKEVRSWPFVGWLARLQRTVFVDRSRRTSLHRTSTYIANRLQAGGKILFFPEGTRGNGNRVLPFKSSLFAVVRPRAPANAKEAGAEKAGSAGSEGDANLDNVQVQTITLAYTHAGGLPLGRARRPLVACYGNMNLASHAWSLLRAGPLDVHVAISTPMPLDHFPDRKALASVTEHQVRTALAAMLTNGGHMPASRLEIGKTPDMTAVPANASG